MTVFIGFDTNDSQLAHQLSSAMQKRGVDSYLFDLNPEYDSSLYNKITNAIKNSQAMVAIVSNGNCSPSVHQEIGYAMAKKIPVIVMLEKGANDGILSYGNEKEIFTRDDLEDSYRRILDYLDTSTLNVSGYNGHTSFLRERHLDSMDSSFSMGGSAKNLQGKELKYDTRSPPAVLFSACPTKLLDNLPIISQEYSQWAKQFASIPMDGCNVRFLRGNRIPGLRKVRYYHESKEFYTRYLEILANGFVEQGFTYPLVRTYNDRRIGTNTMLNLCWITGALNAFLVFSRAHYTYHGYVGEIELILSIRHASKLVLMGFGGTTDTGTKWAEPSSINWGESLPTTDEMHIRIPQKILMQNLSDVTLSSIVRRFSNDIASAYEMDPDMCYNHNGTINSDMLDNFN